MADIKLDIINQARTKVGEDPVASVSETDHLSVVAATHYDDLVLDELENAAWQFARKTLDTPTLLTAQSGGQLKYQWQIPSDSLGIIDVLHCARALAPGDYLLEEDYVRTAHNTEISLIYYFRPDEAEWPRRFRRLIYRRLVAIFLGASERMEESETADQDADHRALLARHSEARQRRSRPESPGSLADARMGRRSRRWLVQ